MVVVVGLLLAVVGGGAGGRVGAVGVRSTSVPLVGAVVGAMFSASCCRALRGS